MIFSGNTKISQAEISAKITKADGTVQDLGVIAFYSSNPVLRWLWKLNSWLQSKIIN